MPDMNGAGPVQGTGPMTGRQMGTGAPTGTQTQQPQIVQELRQMDHEQLVMVAVQLITRLQELQARMQPATNQQPGGVPAGSQF